MFYSIIIPCYNCEKTISNTLNSLLEQKTKKQFEIICVDDGSIDNTKKEIQKIKSKKVGYFYQKNKGPAKARNIGAKKAKGEIILFIDSDCVAEKNWLEEMIKPFDDKKVVAVQGAYKTKQKELTARFSQIEIEERYEKMKKSKSIDWVGSYSAAYNKKEYFSVGGFDESFPIASGEDPELSYKLHEKGGRIVFNPRAIVYHFHPKKLSKYLKIKFFRAFYRPRMYSKHKKKMLKDSYTPQTLKLQIICFYLVILALIFSLLAISLVFVALFFLIIHLLLGAKLFSLSWKKDKAVALASPIILFLRSVVFGIGLIWGKING